MVDGLSKLFMYLFLGLMAFLVFRDIRRSARIHSAIHEMEKDAAAEKAVGGTEKPAP